MKLVTFRNFVMLGGLALFILMSAPYETRAQGRSRDDSKWDKKCAKFVNCHDASEGRVDGRGPRRGADNDDWNWKHIRHGRNFDRDNDRRQIRRNHRDRRFDRYDRRHRRSHDQTWSRRGRY